MSPRRWTASGHPAPYFHNGSVADALARAASAASARSLARSEDGYDQQRVGLEVQELDRSSQAALSPPASRRHYFNTETPGKSAAGHDFPDLLSEDEKQAVLEYLKTL